MRLFVRAEEPVPVARSALGRFVARLRRGQRQVIVTTTQVTVSGSVVADLARAIEQSPLAIAPSYQSLSLRGAQLKPDAQLSEAGGGVRDGDEIVCSVSRPRIIYVAPNAARDAPEAAHNEALEPLHGNSITTTTYTWWNFLPFFLLKELNPASKFANFYFLIVCCLQLVGPVSVTNGAPYSLMPLVCVLGFQALLDIKENVQKAWGDRLTNSAPILILDQSSGELVAKQWKDVRIGDVVKVVKKLNRKDPNGVFPADLLFLASSAPQLYHAQVNTKSLDGETDNKMRKALRRVQRDLGDAASTEDDAAWDATVRRWVVDPNGPLGGARVECEHPNNKTNEFSGRIAYGGTASNSEVLAIEQVLLRGCLLVQADWVYGIAVTTGVDAKINFVDASDKVVAKRCSLEQVVNQQIMLICLLLCCVCAIGAIGFASYSKAVWPVWYLNDHTIGAGWLELAAANGDNEARSDRYGVPGLGAVMMMATYFLLNYQFIPVSLYVTMGGVRTIQKIFMERDSLMYDADEDEPAIVRTLELNDELGQVSHIFSDKTGTLTNNMMVFRKCWVAGRLYGHGITDIGYSNRKAAGEDMTHFSELMREENERPRGAGYHRFVSFLDCDGVRYCGEASLAGDIAEAPADRPGSRASKLLMFGVAMALNHTCEKEDGPPEDLSGSSPDEKAFVAAAHDIFGVRFVRHDQQTNATLIEIDDAMLECKILEKGDGFKYTSSRKRMSMIVRIPEYPQIAGLRPGIWVLSKGADSVIYESLAVDERSGELFEAADREHLEHVHADWADDALRGLVFAGKHLGEDAYAEWSAAYDSALLRESSIADAKAKAQFHEDAVHPLVVRMETDLVLLGASACEDKLQREVPDCIEVLMEAGISIWMITGDKVGTAKNIAVACRLLLPLASMRRVLLTEPDIDSELFPEVMDVVSLPGDAAPARAREPSTSGKMLKYLKTTRLAAIAKEHATDPEKAEAAMRDLKEEFPGLVLMESRLRAEANALMTAAERGEGGGTLMTNALPIVSSSSSSSVPQASNDVPLALVIDEKAIDFVMNPANNSSNVARDNLKELLLQLSLQCKSVVACRARKDQKKLMTLLIKEGVPGSVTLSIGDGANDVDMINAAHIGVAVIGKEGREAVNNSDFAIGQFRFLARLLLVHGRLNYYRMSKVIPFIFYKNVILVLAQFWFSFFAACSGQKVYPEAGLQCFNTWLTAWPIVLLGVLDRDVSDSMAMRFPRLYEDGIYKRFFSAATFWAWQAEALFISFITFFFTMFATENSAFGGSHIGVWEMGAVMFTLVVIVVNTRVSLEMSRFHWTYHAVWWGMGPVLWAIIAFSYSSLTPTAILAFISDLPAANVAVIVANMPSVYFLVPLVLVTCMARALYWKGDVRVTGARISIGPKRQYRCGPPGLCAQLTGGRLKSCCGCCGVDACCQIGPQSKYEQAIFPIELSRPRLYHLVQEVQLGLASPAMEAELNASFGIGGGGGAAADDEVVISSVVTGTAAEAPPTPLLAATPLAATPPVPPSARRAIFVPMTNTANEGVPRLSLSTVVRLKSKLGRIRMRRNATGGMITNEEASQFNSVAVSAGHERRKQRQRA